MISSPFVCMNSDVARGNCADTGAGEVGPAALAYLAVPYATAAAATAAAGALSEVAQSKGTVPLHVPRGEYRLPRARVGPNHHGLQNPQSAWKEVARGLPPVAPLRKRASSPTVVTARLIPIAIEFDATLCDH